ncbi:homoserine dehydrogenase [Guptibacillus algicola]|uniref:homoserine dehydrogenase n=1 Tax=Guptibacillus algicola TaxID=225844 RepID=UPI001CD364CC|nr:homoserine dehydrogenase [Alkalihalobacillus algicola]MCA0986683.1 homoserine dehydrogenase [Alkalihalobacillus algicola]
MDTLHVALIGFGTVGKGIYQCIEKQREQLESLLQKKISIDAILIKNAELQREVDEGTVVTTEFDELLNLPQLDVVFEAINGVEPAETYLSRLIEKGCHIVTANKELLATSGSRIRELAATHKVGLRYEASVAASIPILSTLREGVRSNQLSEISGILNGTSNFILNELQEKGITFEEALRVAQDKGYAEADPKNDIDGWDAFYKILILSDIVYGQQPKWENVVRKGISDVTSFDIKKAEAIGLRIKHTANLSLSAEGPVISVEPVAISNTHPFFNVTGVNNAVCVSSNLAGDITLQGPGAGAEPTASAMIEDLLSLHRNSTDAVYYSSLEKAEDGDQNFLLIGDDAALSNLTFLPSSEEGAYYATGNRRDIEAALQTHPHVKVYPMYGTENRLTPQIELI